jgi:hypothetical protein
MDIIHMFTSGPFSALTDALIAGIAKGSQAYKLVGSYVETPLNWYVNWRILSVCPPELPTGLSSLGKTVSSSRSKIFKELS